MFPLKAKVRSNKNKFDCNLKSVADKGGGGGGGPGHLDSEIRGGGRSPPILFGPYGPHFGLKLRHGVGNPGHSPGSATASSFNDPIKQSMT